jgi:uncharacterized membrane-anchored protein YhcB (DUF1043 family)
MFLLEVIPLASWLGAATTTLVAIIAFFLKDAYAKMTKKQEEVEKDITNLRADMNKDNRELENKLNNTHITLLGKLQEVINTFNNARK